MRDKEAESPPQKDASRGGLSPDAEERALAEEIALQKDIAQSKPPKRLKASRVILPVIIGLGVVGYMFYRDFDPEVFDNIHFTWATVFWIVMAFVFMFGRDIGYMIRIRVLSHRRLNWRQAFRVIMLWEATSAVTPAALGGTSVAILFVYKEGIDLGRSSAIVMLTSFFDELYFTIVFPIVMFGVGVDRLFDISLSSGALTTGLMAFALIGYFIKLAWTVMMGYGLFVNPKGIKWLIEKIFTLPFLRRWHEGAHRTGVELVEAATDIRGSGWRFWLGATGATFLSWSSRFLVANALIIAFFSVSDNLLLFARQLIMWTMMLVVPTPGGSGFAEVIFSTYCRDLITVPLYLQLSAATLIAFFWRGVTYYPYILAGIIVFPNWIRRSFGRSSKKS